MIPVLCDKIYLLVVPSQACRTIAHMSERNRFCDHTNLNTENPRLSIGLLYLVFHDTAWIKPHTSNSLFKKKMWSYRCIAIIYIFIEMDILNNFLLLLKIRKIMWNEIILLKPQMVRKWLEWVLSIILGHWLSQKRKRP